MVFGGCHWLSSQVSHIALKQYKVLLTAKVIFTNLCQGNANDISCMIAFKIEVFFYDVWFWSISHDCEPVLNQALGPSIELPWCPWVGMPGPRCQIYLWSTLQWLHFTASVLPWFHQWSSVLALANAFQELLNSWLQSCRDPLGFNLNWRSIYINLADRPNIK